jgi:hydrogenase maturation factor
MDEVGDRVLGLGKVSTEVLERSVFPFLPLEDEPGLDGGVVRGRGELVVAHSPSIGVPPGALGFFGFHYAASNVAARFSRPRHLVVGIYLPLGTREEVLRTITRAFGAEAGGYGATVAAGQTATYRGLEIPLMTVTCMGERCGGPRTPGVGDSVYVLGEVGGEAVWLKGLAKGEDWRAFTPLPVMLALMGVEGVSLMHDVSEGGVSRALYEVAEALGLGLGVSSEEIVLADGVGGIGEDPLRLPSYGAMVALVHPGAGEAVEGVCGELGVACSEVGVVREGEGLLLDGCPVEGFDRLDLDGLYGTFGGG